MRNPALAHDEPITTVRPRDSTLDLAADGEGEGAYRAAIAYRQALVWHRSRVPASFQICCDARATGRVRGSMLNDSHASDTHSREGLISISSTAMARRIRAGILL